MRQFPFGILNGATRRLCSLPYNMAAVPQSQHDRKLLSLSNKPLVKFLLGMLTATSLGSCSGLAYLLTSMPKCDIPKAENALDALRFLSCSSKDVAISILIGFGSYAITMAYRPLMDILAWLKEKYIDNGFKDEDVDSVDIDEAPASWPDFTRCLNSLMNCVNMDDTAGVSTDGDDDRSSRGSQKSSVLLIDAPIPNPRGMTKGHHYQQLAYSKDRVHILQKKKRTLERRLKTEAKFYALQERLSELLARDSPPDGDKEAPFREPVNKTRKAMLKLNERLESVEKELAAVEE